MTSKLKCMTRYFEVKKRLEEISWKIYTKLCKELVQIKGKINTNWIEKIGKEYKWIIYQEKKESKWRVTQSCLTLWFYGL